MSILGITFLSILHMDNFSIHQIDIFCLHYVRKNVPYAIQTKILLSIPDKEIVYIFQVEKSIFVYILRRYKFSLSGIDKTSYFIVHTENISLILIRNITYISIKYIYLNSTKNSVFISINSVHIKVNNDYEFFVFPSIHFINKEHL